MVLTHSFPTRRSSDLKRERERGAARTAGGTVDRGSDGEFARLLALGERAGRRPRVAVRVNPDFELKASGMKMGGGAKPFGVDVPLVPALLKRIGDAGCDFRGFHIFSGSQNLDASALIEAQAKTETGRASCRERVCQ